MQSVWNTPQGYTESAYNHGTVHRTRMLTMPHSISPTSRATTLCAVKKMAVQAMTRTRQPMTVHRYPNRSDTQPLIKRPISSPILALPESASSHKRPRAKGGRRCTPVADSGLPRCRNLPLSAGQLLSVLAVELGEAVEVVDQADVVAFLPGQSATSQVMAGPKHRRGLP